MAAAAWPFKTGTFRGGYPVHKPADNLCTNWGCGEDGLKH
jgi:hypothetical protein